MAQRHSARSIAASPSNAISTNEIVKPIERIGEGPRLGQYYLP